MKRSTMQLVFNGERLCVFSELCEVRSVTMYASFVHQHRTWYTREVNVLQLPVFLSTGCVFANNALGIHPMMHWSREAQICLIPGNKPTRKDQSGRRTPSLTGRTSKEGPNRKIHRKEGPFTLMSEPLLTPSKRARSVHLLRSFLVMKSLTLPQACPFHAIVHSKPLTFVTAAYVVRLEVTFSQASVC